mgnify:FL=1|tara:strand:- start:1035 stop:1406 length:372 start_codon:yes stop_codon:yes gene_type:complete
MVTFSVIAGFVIFFTVVRSLGISYRKKFSRGFIFASSVYPMFFGMFFVLFGTMIGPEISSDFALGITLTGICLYIFALYKNFSHAGLEWGLVQNVFQTLIVGAFSVIILIGALLFFDSKNKEN